VSAAPDYVEPIVGWRTWLVVREGEGLRLRSVVYDTPLVPAQRAHRPLSQLAPCLLLAMAQTLRARPARSRLRLRHLRREGTRRGASYLEGRSWADALGVRRVIGTVPLWGRVVECTRGWRGSHAYPNRIYVPATRAPYWLRAERAEGSRSPSPTTTSRSSCSMRTPVVSKSLLRPWTKEPPAANRKPTSERARFELSPRGKLLQPARL